MIQKNDFSKYARSEFGISSLKLHYANNAIEDSMTPYILEERQMRATQMDIFSRLMMDRIVWIGTPVGDEMAMIIQAQLMYLSSVDGRDITMHIDTPGGSVKSGLQIVDVMDYIDCDIRTINTGMAASMGSVLLGAGTKGKRASLRFSKVMIHQSSGGFRGNIQDAQIDWKEWQEVNNLLFELLGGYCGKDPEVVKEDAKRDLWLSSEEALNYGIIDEIVTKKSKKNKK